jgi:hypothetical protein
MYYDQEYIADYYEYAEDLEQLNSQLEKMGFDITNPGFMTFAHFQTTEGYDVYDDIRQIWQQSTNLDKSAAIISFELQAIKMEHELDFALNQMTVRLYLMGASRFEKQAELSYGKQRGFASKAEMLEQLWDHTNRKLLITTAQAKAESVMKNIGHRKQRQYPYRPAK